MIVNRILSHFRIPLPQIYSSFQYKFSHSSSSLTPSPQTETSDAITKKDSDDGIFDKLYKTLQIEVKGHDNAVLKSYQMFVSMTAKELDITLEKCWEPWRYIKRRTLLRSAFVKKKYRVQYEWRTYFRVMQFKHITESTADTFVEYIQRNVPEGVAMKVNKIAIESMPLHIKAPDHVPDHHVPDHHAPDHHHKAIDDK